MSGACVSSLPMLLVLLSARVCECVSADLPRDFGVKLCGREFIRAVIFTCGGSRWRRENSPVEGREWQQEALGSAEEPSLSHTSLVPLLKMLGSVSQKRMKIEESERRSRWIDSHLFSSDHYGAAANILPGVSVLPQHRSPFAPLEHSRRSLSGGLAGMCCSQGCTKHDIGRLC